MFVKNNWIRETWIKLFSFFFAIDNKAIVYKILGT